MTRRHIAAATGLLALAPLTTACLVGPGTPGSGPGGMFDNVCEIILVPADSGLQPGSPASGLITGQIELNCSTVPTSQHVTLSLSADEGGGMVPRLSTFWQGQAVRSGLAEAQACWTARAALVPATCGLCGQRRGRRQASRDASASLKPAQCGQQKARAPAPTDGRRGHHADSSVHQFVFTYMPDGAQGPMPSRMSVNQTASPH
jgi:hypothetical protein